MKFQAMIVTMVMGACISATWGMPVPVGGDKPVALDKLRVGNAAVLPMTGTWRFMLDRGGTSPSVNGALPPAALATVPDFALPATSDATWKDIPVPSNWEIEGFSRPTFQTPDNDIGLYRRQVDVPADFAGKKVLWHFDGSYDGTEVFVNGQRAGYHESGFTAFDIDVTKFLQPGKKNLFAVRVYKNTPTSVLDKGDFWCLGGIYRENYLVAAPPLHVEDITVVTDLDAQYKDATLRSTVVVNGPPNTHFSLAGNLLGLDGAPLATAAIGREGDLDASGTATVTLEVPVTAPKLWSAEKPNLYYLFVRLTGPDKAAENVQERFGFKKVENKNGVVLWNGVPIKCTGTCRHEEFSPYGHALTEEAWETDVKLLKGANINAIRTSHYNHAARFLELCDEAGFYVLDEVPFCWVSNELGNVSRQWAYIQRSKETLDRDKDRACVMAWSMGNEKGYGINAQAALDYMKAHDATHLALISQQGLNVKGGDFEDSHYPSLDKLRQIAASPNRQKLPAIITEQPHIFCVKGVMDYDYGNQDFWGQGLNNNWDIIWKSDSMVGSFIWEWQDQGMADKFMGDRRGVDAATGLRDNNYKGVVTATRQPKPEYYNVKMTYTPVVVDTKRIAPANGTISVPVQNRYSFTNLAELTCRWQALAAGKELARGDARVACDPRTSGVASFPATAGMDTLHVEFVHPDGRTIISANLRTADYQPPQALPAIKGDGPPQLTETADEVVIKGASTLTFDKKTGLIKSWNVGNEAVVVGGPILNLGEQLVPGQGARGRVTAVQSPKPPELRNAVLTAKMNGDTAHVSVTSDVYLTNSPELKGQLTYTFDVGSAAQADFTWKLAWKAADTTAYEAGIKFLLPAADDHLSWSSENRWTDYPADHIGNTFGTVTSKDISFRSSKRDIHWVALSGAGKNSFVALSTGDAKQPIHARGLATANGTLMILTSAIAIPGDFSSNLFPGYDIRLTQATPLSSAFQLRIAASR